MPVVLHECVPAHRVVRTASSENDTTSVSVVTSNRWSPPLPTAHTITLLVPSVDVTKGDPTPFWLTFHTLVIVGGLAGLMRKRGKIIAVHAVSDVCALFGSITCRCIDDEAVGKMQ